jgi:AcrR family transcriptional regulator
MRSDERRAQILEGASAFFSEHGLAGNTRELSASLGIAQPLLYRYFPSKQILLDTVFEELFVKRWSPSWKGLITDDTRPLGERIEAFYTQFDARLLTREWVRLFVFSGLEGYPYNRRVFRKLMSDVFRPLGVELRRRHALPVVGPEEITRMEIEMIWELHGVVFYHRMRQHVYGMKVHTRIEEVIANLLFYLDGAAPRVLAQLFPGQVKLPGRNEAPVMPKVAGRSLAAQREAAPSWR